MRWLVLDEIIEIRKGSTARTRSHIPQEKEFSAEVLLLEMMAQTGGLLAGAENDYKEDTIFAKIESSEFPVQGRPGEPLEIIATLETWRPEACRVEAVVQNQRGIFAKARFMLAQAGKLVPGSAESITFHQGFMSHFKVREKVR